MKQQLLHGPGIDNSRKKLLEIKQKFNPENILVFEKGADIQDILAALQTVPLFEEEKLIVVENPTEDLPPSPFLIIWYDHEVKNLPEGFEVLFFPEEKEASIFPLLDSLGNKSKKAHVELYKRNKTSPNDTQYILTMVYYLLRSLVATPKKAGDFVRNKNARMRNNFAPKDLAKLYRSVLEIDFKIKNGQLEPSQAEFLLVNIFTHN